MHYWKTDDNFIKYNKCCYLILCLNKMFSLLYYSNKNNAIGLIYVEVFSAKEKIIKKGNETFSHNSDFSVHAI